MNRTFVGKLADGSYGIKIFKTTDQRLYELIKVYGKWGYVSKKAASKIAKELDDYYEDIKKEAK